MFYSHQILAKKTPLGQIWMAATLHCKINRKKLDKLDIIQICEEILNPSVPMALRLSATLMGGVVKVYERKVKFLFDDVNRLMVEINRACSTKEVQDHTLLPKGRTRARKETITLPENVEADFGDFEETGTIPIFGDFQPLDEFIVEVNLETEDVGQKLHQANPEDITLFEHHSSFQTNNETYNQFERFDDELPGAEIPTTLIPSPPRGPDIPEGAEIPTTLIPSPPRGPDIPEGVNPEIPQQHQDHGGDVFAGVNPEIPQQHQDHGGDVFAEHIVEGDNRQQPPKKRARKTTTSMMDYEQTVITGDVYQSWLQNTSDIVCKGNKRKVRGTIRPEMKFFKLMNMPSTLLFEKDAESSYPPHLKELWSKCTHLLQTSSPETRLPDFREEQSPSFEQDRMQNNHQADPHQGSDISSQNLGRPIERRRKIQTGKGLSVERMMAGSRASFETINHQADDINPEPFFSGDDVRSMPSIPSERGAAEKRRGLEAVTEVLFETGSATQTQKQPVCNQSEEKLTEKIKSQLKTHFDTPGAPQVESLNKLTFGMDRSAAAKLFYQSCVLATRGAIKVNQTQPYGDILISKGPNM